MTERSLFASNLGVAGGTLASRVTGLARLIVFAAVIVQTALADAFYVGNNEPNVIYELLLGGTLTANEVTVPERRRYSEPDSLRLPQSLRLQLWLRRRSFACMHCLRQGMPQRSVTLVLR